MRTMDLNRFGTVNPATQNYEPEQWSGCGISPQLILCRGNHRFVDRAPGFGLYNRRLFMGLTTQGPPSSA